MTVCSHPSQCEVVNSCVYEFSLLIFISTACKMWHNLFFRLFFWSQWRAYRKPLSLFPMVPSLIPYDLSFPQNVGPKCTPVQTSQCVLPPGEYDRRYWQAVCSAGCRYEPSDVAFCQITLALVITVLLGIMWLGFWLFYHFKYIQLTEMTIVVQLYVCGELNCRRHCVK